MSLKYRDSAGTETPVAGLNGTSGELVPSVALQQSGTARISMPNTSALTDLFTLTVTFDTPFDDTDYVLNVDQCEVSEAEINRVYDKTTTGFTVAVMYNRKLTAVPSYNVTARIPWTAFKLMTDTVHEADSAHIAQNTANFASAFSEVTSYAVGDYVTYNNILYRCTAAHTAGVWVAGHFTQVTVGGELKPISGTIPLDTGWSGTCKYSKSGNTVTLTFSQLKANSTSESALIARLPTNLIPKESCFCVLWINDADNIQILNLTDSGAISVGGTAGVRTSDAFGSVTFVTN